MVRKPITMDGAGTSLSHLEEEQRSSFSSVILTDNHLLCIAKYFKFVVIWKYIKYN